MEVFRVSGLGWKGLALGWMVESKGPFSGGIGKIMCICAVCMCIYIYIYICSAGGGSSGFRADGRNSA